MVLPGHLEQLLLGAVAELGLPETGRPLGQKGGVAGHVGVTGGDLGRGAGRDPVVDLAGAVRDPAGGAGPELNPAHGRVVPEQAVAPAGDDKGHGDLGVALDQVDHEALLVQPAVGVLAEAEKPLALVGGEALFEALVAVAPGGEIARPRPPEVYQ